VFTLNNNAKIIISFVINHRSLIEVDDTDAIAVVFYSQLASAKPEGLIAAIKIRYLCK
jgi:hypothetical protein